MITDMRSNQTLCHFKSTSENGNTWKQQNSPSWWIFQLVSHITSGRTNFETKALSIGLHGHKQQTFPLVPSTGWEVMRVSPVTYQQNKKKDLDQLSLGLGMRCRQVTPQIIITSKELSETKFVVQLVRSDKKISPQNYHSFI